MENVTFKSLDKTTLELNFQKKITTFYLWFDKLEKQKCCKILKYVNEMKCLALLNCQNMHISRPKTAL